MHPKAVTAPLLVHVLFNSKNSKKIYPSKTEQKQTNKLGSSSNLFATLNFFPMNMKVHNTSWRSCVWGCENNQSNWSNNTIFHWKKSQWDKEGVHIAFRARYPSDNHTEISVRLRPSDRFKMDCQLNIIIPLSFVKSGQLLRVLVYCQTCVSEHLWSAATCSSPQRSIFHRHDYSF